MTWHRLDAGYFSNPKVRRLSARAKCLDIAGISYCNRELTDGVIANERLPIVLAEACATRAQLGELIAQGRWTQSASEVRVHHFESSNPSADKVLKAREKHSELIKRLRKGVRDQVTDQVTDPISDAQAEGNKVKGLEGKKVAVSSNGSAENNGAAAYPTSVDGNMIVSTWAALSGEQPTEHDRGHAGWWLSEYHRLGANRIAGILTTVFRREAGKGNRIKTLTYFDAAIREANDAAKPPRAPGDVHVIGERLVPVIPRGLDYHGNPEP